MDITTKQLFSEMGFKWLNRRHLTYQMHLHGMKQQEENVFFSNSTTTSNLSDMTDDEDYVPSDVDPSSVTEVQIVHHVANQGGRPKGSTVAAKEKQNTLLKDSITAAAREFLAKKEEAEANRSYFKKGTLKNIITKIEQERNLPEKTIPFHTVRTRVSRRNVLAYESYMSPMIDIEKVIVEYCVELAQIGCALNKDQVLSLAEDFIHDTKIAKDLVEFKSKRGITRLYYSNGKAVVGNGWYSNFMKRNKHKIKRQRPKVRDCQRLTYCTYSNFEFMYETVYEDMVSCGAAIKLDSEVHVNAKGEIVEDIKEAVGLPTKYLLTNPKLVLFVDETGSNTNQKTDPYWGNEKRIVGTDGDGFGLAGSVSDNHFTVMCFQSATGEPVVCCIIFKSQGGEGHVRDVPLSWKSGIDVRKLRTNEYLQEPEELQKLYIDNETHEDVVLGGGPVCHFNGKRIPTYCCCSPSASITSSILTDMLRYIDDLELYDRSDGTNPFLLLDGHHSRMDLEFLQYINDKKHKWNVCIGVPYGTHIWQVADSSQINGLYKVIMAKMKSEYMQYKNDNEALCVTNIVPIARSSFKKSFGNIENTKKAISARGWGPALNYCLLLDPRLSGKPAAVADQSQSTNPASTSSSTLTEGTTVLASIVEENETVQISLQINKARIGSSFTDAIVEYRNKDAGRARLVEEKKKQFENKQVHIDTIKKIGTLSSGQMMSNRWLCLDDTVLQNRNKRKQEDAELKEQQLVKRKKREDNQQQRYQTAINKCLNSKETLTMEDYTSIIKQITNKGDSPIRKQRAQMVEQIKRRINRLDKYLPLSSCECITQHVIDC